VTRLLQISDTHFGTEQPEVMKALLALAHAEKPDVLVLSGDITQRASADQFSRARNFCDDLAIPRMLSLPGNHDIPLFNVFSRLFRPYGAYLHAFGPELEPQLQTSALCLLGVKTTRRWRHKNGQVSDEQIERVCSQLHGATAQQLRIVVVHQPVHVLRTSDEHDRLRGWEAAVRAWAAAGADLVMGGHIHLPYVCELSASVAGLDRRMWCVQAGTALSSRVRREAPNSVNLLRYRAGSLKLQCEVERWDFDAATARFVMAQSSNLTLDRSDAGRVVKGKNQAAQNQHTNANGL
jgi:3',5'-cyclic AMP phosphodiesterase CpdA